MIKIMKLSETQKKVLIIMVALTIVSGYSTYILVANAVQYTKIIETEAQLSMEMVDIEVEGDPEDIVYFTSTVRIWNNGSTPVIIYQIQYELHLNEVSPLRDSWVGSKGGYLYREGENIHLEPGESITYRMTPLEHNVSQFGDSIILRNSQQDEPMWNWIITNFAVNMYMPEFDSGRWAYHTRLRFQHHVFNREITEGDTQWI